MNFEILGRLNVTFFIVWPNYFSIFETWQAIITLPYLRAKQNGNLSNTDVEMTSIPNPRLFEVASTQKNGVPAPSTSKCKIDRLGIFKGAEIKVDIEDVKTVFTIDQDVKPQNAPKSCDTDVINLSDSDDEIEMVAVVTSDNKKYKCIKLEDEEEIRKRKMFSVSKISRQKRTRQLNSILRWGSLDHFARNFEFWIYVIF